MRHDKPSRCHGPGSRRVRWRSSAALVAILVGPAAIEARAGQVASYLLRFTVPPVPEDLGKSSPGGWGAIVLEFDGPAAGTGLMGAKFKFPPACPDYAPGIPNDLASDFPRIQLGPGGYGLGPTGGVITQPPDSPFLGQKYGFLDVIVEYDPGASGAPPMVVSAFWQNKPTIRGVRIFEFNPELDMVASVPAAQFIPEPATLVLGLLGLAIGTIAHRTRRTIGRTGG
jgi:hypothetical protein